MIFLVWCGPLILSFWMHIYSPRVIFMEFEERSKINMCIQPAYLWEDKIICFSLLSKHTRVSCGCKTPQRDGGKGGEEREKKLFNLFSLLLLYWNCILTRAWCWILFPGDILCSWLSLVVAQLGSSDGHCYLAQKEISQWWREVELLFIECWIVSEVRSREGGCGPHWAYCCYRHWAKETYECSYF